MNNINWYPGHMKKTRELIKENLKLVDAVIEVIDARIPGSSRNPVVDQLVGTKPRIIVLNKMDLADETETRRWVACLTEDRTSALALNANNGQGVKELFRMLNEMRAGGLLPKEGSSAEKSQSVPEECQSVPKESQLMPEECQSVPNDGNTSSAGKEENVRAVRKNRPFRIMVVGVPNVGKSSLINRMTGRKSTQIGDRPGVTKGKQWLTLQNGIQLLDTPGILWPKFEDPKVGLALAYCGSIKDEIMDPAELGLSLVGFLSEDYPEELNKRYGLETPGESPLEIMEQIAEKRGFILAGKRIDYERCGRTVLDEFRSGRIGRITIEKAISSQG